jgi:hypothetical protein
MTDSDKRRSRSGGWGGDEQNWQNVVPVHQIVSKLI